MPECIVQPAAQPSLNQQRFVSWGMAAAAAAAAADAATRSKKGAAAI